MAVVKWSLVLLLLLGGCSLAVPEHVPRWKLSVANSPYTAEQLSQSMDSLAEDWTNTVGDSLEDLQFASEWTSITWWYDVAGEQHLPHSDVHGRYYSDKRIELAWTDGDEIEDTSWRHEWAHLFLYELRGDLDPNHLGPSGPWDEKVQMVVSN
jgi:hypothetical protein